VIRANPVASPRHSRADALPQAIEPMLAVSGDLPADPDNWGFEYKWDGVRCMTIWNGRELRLLSRNHRVITQRYPELAAFGPALGKQPIILDGEIIALDAAAHPSFGELQQRMHVDHPGPELVRRTPVWYVVFDVLYSNGHSILDLPYARRREILETKLTAGANWHLSPFHVDRGEAMLESARKNCMEGVVAKLLTSEYLPGRRSPAWRKIKVVFGQEFVIGGWIPEKGDRLDRVGALLLGYYGRGGGDKTALRYAGRVGTGFDAPTHAMLVAALKPLTTSTNSFADPFPRGGAIFVKPALVAEVQYRRWPEDGLIQQASFKGLRDDKPARKIIREPQTKGAS
jgi:bifunctional non-homologous end joining protein LigD